MLIVTSVTSALMVASFCFNHKVIFSHPLGSQYAKSVATVAGLVTEPITAAADNVVLEAEQFLEGGWITKWDLTIT